MNAKKCFKISIQYTPIYQEFARNKKHESNGIRKDGNWKASKICIYKQGKRNTKGNIEIESDWRDDNQHFEQNKKKEEIHKLIM